MTTVVVGIDVGGTNTDAVVLQERHVISSSKTPTTSDVTSGVCIALTQALNEAHCLHKGGIRVSRVHIGTTHFVNAVIQKRHLEKVAVIRLCGTATRSLPPFSLFPPDLKQIMYGGDYLVDGGYQFNGQVQIAEVNQQQLEEVAASLREQQVNHVVVSGVFSPVNSSHEEQATKILYKANHSLSITMSHSIGQLGLLERENAAVLNESLRPLAARTVTNFQEALHMLGLTCPLYLSQNDGTLLSAENAMLLPVYTFVSGPTNSIRGATFLSGEDDAIVVDIGGTSTDIGVIVKGFPREAGMKAQVTKYSFL